MSSVPHRARRPPGRPRPPQHCLSQRGCPGRRHDRGDRGGHRRQRRHQRHHRGERHHRDQRHGGERHRGERHRARGSRVGCELPVAAVHRASRHPGQRTARPDDAGRQDRHGQRVGYANGTTGYVGHIAANPGLCIPGLNLEDGPQGVADGVPGVTQLPAPVALAAAWDPALARDYGSVVGSEERGKGADVNLGPTVNIVRDPRWGRAFESYGEDPYLTGQTAVGYIDGVQSQGVLSQVKHFAVYNQETNRNTAADDAIVSPRAMHEIYLPQFQAAVQQARAASVMCSYSTVNGQYACQNSYLMNVLDNEWHFPGFVTSDWGATHSTVPSALAGLDMNMPGGTGFGPDYYGAPLQGGGAGRPGADDRAGRHGVADPHRDVPVQLVRQPAHRVAERDRYHPGARTDRPGRGRGGRRAAEERRRRAAAAARTDQSIAVIGADGGQYALTSGGGSAGVIAPYTVTP